MSVQQALALPSPAASDTVVINARCTFRREGDQRVVVVAGLPVHHYCAHDPVAEAYAMVFLVESGFARQTEVARAFTRSVRTVRRHQERYAQGGMAALGRGDGWRRGHRRISGKRLRTVEMLKSQGLSNRRIAQRLGVSEKAIRKLVVHRRRPSSSPSPRPWLPRRRGRRLGNRPTSQATKRRLSPGEHLPPALSRAIRKALRRTRTTTASRSR
jgi:transposase